MIKRCSDCIYYRPPEMGVYGKCHRYPPDNEGKWPLIGESGWCGEFSMKEEHAHYDIYDALGRATGKDPLNFKQYRVDDGGVAM